MVSDLRQSLLSYPSNSSSSNSSSRTGVSMRTIGGRSSSVASSQGSETSQSWWEWAGCKRAVSCLKGSASWVGNASYEVAKACFGSPKSCAITASTAGMIAVRALSFGAVPNALLSVGVGMGVRLLVPAKANPTVSRIAMTLLGQSTIEVAAQIYFNVKPIFVQALGTSVTLGILGANIADLCLWYYHDRFTHIDSGNGPEPSQVYFKGIFPDEVPDFSLQLALGTALLAGSFKVESALLQRVLGFFGAYYPFHVLGELVALGFSQKVREIDTELNPNPEGIPDKIAGIMKSVWQLRKNVLNTSAPAVNAVSFTMLGVWRSVWGFRALATAVGFFTGVVGRSFLERWRTMPIKQLSEFQSFAPGAKSPSLAFRIFRIAHPLCFFGATIGFGIWQWSGDMGEPDPEKRKQAKIELGCAVANFSLFLPSLLALQHAWKLNERLQKTLPSNATLFNNATCFKDFWMRWSQDPHILSVPLSTFFFVITAAVSLSTSGIFQGMSLADRIVRCVGVGSLGAGVAIELIKRLGPKNGIHPGGTNMPLPSGTETLRYVATGMIP